MDKAEEVIEKNINRGEGLFTYMFNYDDDTKSTLLNMMQYMLFAIIPVVVILKLVKEYVPEDDDSKGSVEIVIEIVLQLGILFLSIWFIDRLIRYFPTFSKMPYSKCNELVFILPLLMIMITMQTKLGAKINILVDRITEMWGGTQLHMTQSQQSNNNIRTRQPIAQSHQPSRADTLDSHLIAPPPQMMNTNLNNMQSQQMNNEIHNMQSQHMNNETIALALDDSSEPEAANGFLGSAFGTSSGW